MDEFPEQPQHDVPHEEAPTPSAPTRDLTLPLSIVAAAVMISSSILYLVYTMNKKAAVAPSGNAGTANIAAAVLDPVLKLDERDAVLGDPKAPVAIIEYGDYQCPFCVRFFEQTEPALRDAYVKTGKAKMVFRNFQFVGPESVTAGNAAECAKDQHRFWEYHDALYKTEAADGQENNGNLTRDFLVKTAKELGLDVASFTSCLDGEKYTDFMEKEKESAKSIGVNGTPAIFINETRVDGAQPFEYTGTDPRVTPLKPIIERYLKK